jgi:O-antigen biosynthesis protein
MPKVKAAVCSYTKPEGYFSCTRPELIALVPPTATRILDVGCGAGGFARSLRAARSGSKLEIVGVEFCASAAEIAASAVDRLVVGNAEHVELRYENYFDCVIFADVLEHLIDPWKMLQRARTLLQRDGTIIASIPNVQHWSILANLLRGHWEYAEYGIMDSTHLRFFTRRSISDLFTTTGFRLTRIFPLLSTTTRVRIARLVTASLAIPFLTRQYLVVAERNDK